jgi:DNA-binding CsgD family transcriptional regulator
MAITSRDQRRALVRVLHRPLDLHGYFEAVETALRRLVPFDAACWLSLDPGTWLPTSHISRIYGSTHFMALAVNEYLEEDVNKFAHLAGATRPVGLLSTATGGKLGSSARFAHILAPLGYEGDELRAVFRDGESAWGAVVLHRRAGLFSERDAELVADLGGIVAAGIRRSILQSAVMAVRGLEPPGLIVLRGDDTLESATPAARRLLDEVFDSTNADGAVPLTVVSVAQQARRSNTDAYAGEIAGVRLPMRTGGWLRMDASLLDDDARGRVAVILSAAREPEIATLIAQAYGLSAREREVTGFVLRGRSTQEIADALHVTPYTVQDHLKAIFEKVGVRSRRELVAQLFLQQCAPRLTAGASLAPDGWFADDDTSAAAQPELAVPIR